MKDTNTQNLYEQLEDIRLSIDSAESTISNLRENLDAIKAELASREVESQGSGWQTRLNQGKKSYSYDSTAIYAALPNDLAHAVFVMGAPILQKPVFDALVKTGKISPEIAALKVEMPPNARWEVVRIK